MEDKLLFIIEGLIIVIMILALGLVKCIIERNRLRRWYNERN